MISIHTYTHIHTHTHTYMACTLAMFTENMISINTYTSDATGIRGSNTEAWLRLCSRQCRGCVHFRLSCTWCSTVHNKAKRYFSNQILLRNVMSGKKVCFMRWEYTGYAASLPNFWVIPPNLRYERKSIRLFDFCICDHEHEVKWRRCPVQNISAIFQRQIMDLSDFLERALWGHCSRVHPEFWKSGLVCTIFWKYMVKVRTWMFDTRASRHSMIPYCQGRKPARILHTCGRNRKN